MRNTRLYIIAALVVLVIVVILATILTNRVKNNQNQEQIQQTQQKVETTTAKNLSKAERLREASRITKRSNTSLLTDEQIKKFNELSTKVKAGQNGILSTEDFDIGYSTVTNQFFIQKKIDKADVQLENFLKENNALDIFQTDLSLFIRTNKSLRSYIKEQEESILEVLEEEKQPKEKEKSYEEIKKENLEKNLEVLKKLGNSLFSPSTGGVDRLESLLFEATPEGSTEIPYSTEPIIQGLIYPINLGEPNSKGYYKMPSAQNGEYFFGGWNQCDSHKMGSRTLIGTTYTVAIRWHQKYPNIRLQVSDLNAGDPHQSHRYGVDVDITIYGNWSGHMINAPTEYNIELGKMFIDTGVMKLIIFGDSESDSKEISIRNAWKAYANSKGLTFQTYPYRGHDTHFHVRINDEFRGPLDAPGPCR